MLMLLPLIVALQLAIPPHQKAANLSVYQAPIVAECAIPGSKVVYRLADLPGDVRAQLVGAFDDGFAEVETAFDATDVHYPGRPERRFIRAYQSGTKWMIWYEHGGRGYHWHAVGMRKQSASRPISLDRNAKYVGSDDSLCAASKAYFAGARASEDM
jgi:hypothetical protein